MTNAQRVIIPGGSFSTPLASFRLSFYRPQLPVWSFAAVTRREVSRQGNTTVFNPPHTIFCAPDCLGNWLVAKLVCIEVQVLPRSSYYRSAPVSHLDFFFYHLESASQLYFCKTNVKKKSVLDCTSVLNVCCYSCSLWPAKVNAFANESSTCKRGQHMHDLTARNTRIPHSRREDCIW